ncbi:STAS domain-containing protein [Kineosporia rhizophila]|uniref:STAS domain-containing protein n=1 Tax=Kineosporia TaxID=49184 RepID=UPI001E3D4AFB|nr:STAS domain-containing protein [Kineosporia sp. NBRC 101677]MCE0534863.1 STAS domain-containing protein [Kineosporia rhizophila]GLY14857.1 hypothetical protein Kisp01_18720 [Kineosporia sp. NBRC 101677]
MVFEAGRRTPGRAKNGLRAVRVPTAPSPTAADGAGREPVSVRLGEPIRSADVAGLRAGVATALRSPSPTVVVDVSDVRRLSSTTVTALLWAQRRCRARGGAVLLRGLSRQGERSLRRSGLDQVLAHEPQSEERRRAT